MAASETASIDGNRRKSMSGDDAMTTQPETAHPADASRLTVFGYATGHVFNDLCASMWFTYLLAFLEKVLLIDHPKAGLLMLIGQVTDAISTPLVGLLSDASLLPSFLLRFGKRKAWHEIGTVCVALSFHFIFDKRRLYSDGANGWYDVAYFAPFIMVFQFGWASVQLTCAVDLTFSPHPRALGGGKHSNNHEFTEITGVVCVAVGTVATLLFDVTTKEPIAEACASRASGRNVDSSSCMRWRDWLMQVRFHQVAAMYMLSRVFINVSQAYFPLYITNVQQSPKQYIAILPMVSYLASFVISALLSVPAVNRRLDRKLTFAFGAVLGAANCGLMHLHVPSVMILGVALLMGITQAVLLISSISITTEMIGKHTESGAFVYGAMSFADKLANGILYQSIELLSPTAEEDANRPAADATSAHFYRSVMVFVPGSCAVGICAVLLTVYATRRHNGVRHVYGQA
ncbi:Protein F16H11.1 [Aphelenchoides avenae]|nr:Protein F16H11.1 [Aphelenchus avenae]